MNTARASRADFVRLSKWFTLALCATALILPALLGRPGVWSALSPEHLFSWHTALALLMGLAGGAIVSLVAISWRPLHATTEALAALVAWETFRPRDYVVVAFLAALGEELLFRGAMQPLLGLVPVAVVFGLLHATALAHIVLAGVLGLWLGLLYHWSGNLWSPIAAHLTLDVVTGLLLARTAQATLLLDRGD
jgi:membrane protease YdiL (CAAX protease family)